MKYLWLIFFLIGCGDVTENHCFESNSKKINVYKEFKPFTEVQILSIKPKYLQLVSLKKFRTFKTDSASAHTFSSEKENGRKSYDHDFGIFIKHFGSQFRYLSSQSLANTQYALAKNRLGYWLVKIKGQTANAYFLGLSTSHYYFNEVQNLPIIKDGYFQQEGSLVKIIKMEGLPGYDDYSAIRDGLLFKIKLESIEQDTDGDGYNDIFEKTFGLNPDRKDSDGDGISDWDDMNPLFKSEKNKFTELYEFLINGDNTVAYKDNNHFTFSCYQTDCEYLQTINPYRRTLILPSDKSLQTEFVTNTDLTDGGFSKFRRDKIYQNKIYFTMWGYASRTDYVAEYIHGKWQLTEIGGYVI